MDTTQKLHKQRRRSKPHRQCAPPTDRLDQAIADWPGLGRPLLPETELAILAAFLERRAAIRLLPAST